MSRVGGVAQALRPEAVERLEFDAWVPMGELIQRVQGERPESPQKPYLFADPLLVARWEKKIPRQGKLRVGLRWQGRPSAESPFRDVPFSEYRQLLSIEGCDFYSLQRDTGFDQLQPGDRMVDLAAELSSWEETAAAITQLDLVITSCTSIAHLAGALGKETWLYTPFQPFFVWRQPGNQSVWYPNVRLFRQKRVGDWREVTRQVKSELSHRDQLKLVTQET
jgi:hypothetical protein